MDALRTLQILISLRTPLIAIETLKEERVEQALTHLFSRDRRALVLTAPRVELPERILEEIKATKPLSVTRVEDVEALREWARGRAVPAA